MRKEFILILMAVVASAMGPQAMALAPTVGETPNMAPTIDVMVMKNIICNLPFRCSASWPLDRRWPGSAADPTAPAKHLTPR